MQNEVIRTLLTRRSVREYADREIPQEVIRTILEAGMSGPSCVNARDWAFIAVTDPEMLGRMADANGRPAEPLRGAKLGVLICGDLERAFSGAPDYWVIDATIAAQNMTIAAEALGLGSVWLGTWPQMRRVQAQSALFGLPEHIVPHSILAFGYPREKATCEPRGHWDATRVHFGKW